MYAGIYAYARIQIDKKIDKVVVVIEGAETVDSSKIAFIKRIFKNRVFTVFPSFVFLSMR